MRIIVVLILLDKINKLEDEIHACLVIWLTLLASLIAWLIIYLLVFQVQHDRLQRKFYITQILLQTIGVQREHRDTLLIAYNASQGRNKLAKQVNYLKLSVARTTR